MEIFEEILKGIFLANYKSIPGGTFGETSGLTFKNIPRKSIVRLLK